MNIPLSASDLYCRAAGVTPKASGITSEDSHCVMCAASLPKGTAATPVSKNTFGKAFNNSNDLRAMSGRYVCAACEALWTQDWLQKYSKSFACADGVFRFASNEQQAAFLLNPPEPPFAAIFSTRQQQHMIWRTPVSLSRDYFIVRHDDDLLTIRRDKLLDGLRAYQAAMDLMQSTPLKRTGRKLNPPAAMFSQKLSLQAVGSIRSDVIELLRENACEWVITSLHAMTMGEWWALGVIRHFDPEHPPEWQIAVHPDGTRVEVQAKDAQECGAD